MRAAKGTRRWLTVTPTARRRCRWFAAIMAAGAVCVEAGRAEACSCVTPFENELRVGNAVIPVNAGGVPWWLRTGEDWEVALDAERADLLGLEPFDVQTLAERVVLERVAEDTIEEVLARVVLFDPEGERRAARGMVPLAQTHLFLIRPEAEWSVGDRYRLRIDAGPGVRDPERRFRMVEFEVGPAFELTDGLQLYAFDPQEDSPFPIDQRPTELLLDTSGSCAAERWVRPVSLAVEPRELTDGWPSGILFFETFVDGEPWRPKSSLCDVVEPGASWVGRGRDLVVAVCDELRGSDEEIQPGVHTVRMDVQLPGSGSVYSSETLEVDLSDCLDPDATVTVPEGEAELEGAMLPDEEPAEAPSSDEHVAVAPLEPGSEVEGVAGSQPEAPEPALGASSSGGCSTIPGRPTPFGDAWWLAGACWGLILAAAKRRAPRNS